MKLLPVIVSLTVSIIAVYLYHNASTLIINITDNTIGYRIYGFFNGKYYVDVIYNKYIIGGGLRLGYIVSKYIDRGIIELIGPRGLTMGVTTISQNISKLDTGNVTTYALFMMLGLGIITFGLFSSLFFAAQQTFYLDFRLVFVLFFVLIVANASMNNYDDNSNKSITSSTPNSPSDDKNIDTIKSSIKEGKNSSNDEVLVSISTIFLSSSADKQSSDIKDELINAITKLRGIPEGSGIVIADELKKFLNQG